MIPGEMLKRQIKVKKLPYILESNPHSLFSDFLNGKKLLCDSNPQLSFNCPLIE
jgi:hypothetical protein